MARLALALALCIGAAHGLGGTTLQECPNVKNYGYHLTADCDVLGEACPIWDSSSDGVCLDANMVLKCSCCDGGEGLVPEITPPGPPSFSPYGGVDPGTVLPMCPVL